jgi:hypothetical protein
VATDEAYRLPTDEMVRASELQRYLWLPRLDGEEAKTISKMAKPRPITLVICPARRRVRFVNASLPNSFGRRLAETAESEFTARQDTSARR